MSKMEQLCSVAAAGDNVKDLQDPSPTDERLGAPPTPTSANDLPNGTILANQFRIEKKLGGGGMGTVYRCLDLTVQRQVAIKVLHPHLVGTSKWLLRFQQEARAIARLDHPNIVGVKQLVTDKSGSPFIVMDYIKGTSLADLLSIMGMLAVPRAVEIMAQVADALAHAHDNKVVHRDLKPSNIVIVKGTDVVKILDFGIAKIGDENEPGTAVKLTQTGEVFGSPAYMSPEQVLGKPIDGRSDQYSFGCVLYECLTGTPPFVSNSPVEVMMQHVNNTPVALSEASLGTEFGLRLESVVTKLLAKDPANRYGSMVEVKNALQQAISAESNLFAEDESDKRFEPIKEKKSPIIAVASFLIGCLVTGLVTLVCLSFNQPSRQLTAPLRTSHEEDRQLIAAHRLTDEHFPLSRIILPDGRRQFEFGNESLGKIMYREKGKEFYQRMFGTVVVDKNVDAFTVSVTAKTMIYRPTVLELFAKDNVFGLEIGSESISDLVSDQDVTSAGAPFCDTDAIQRGFVYVQSLKSLKVLTIQSLPLNSTGLRYLDLDNLPNLETLRLAKTTVNARDLAKLKVLPKLHGLDISDLRSCAPVTQALKNSSSLSFYILENCNISDVDLESVAKIKSINLLNLSYNSAITARGLRPLVSLPGLCDIDLIGTKIGADAIPLLSKMPVLQSLRLPKEYWSPADVARLRQLMPKCKVSAEERIKREEP